MSGRDTFTLVIVALLAQVPVARADWGFTHWGMTPEQVVAASGGTVHVLPAAERTRDDSDGWEMSVQGTMQESGLALQGGFMFDIKSGGLKCVLYNASGDDVAKLRDGLMKRYGHPAKESEFMTSRTMTWEKPDTIEFTVNTKPLAGVVSHCAPEK